MKFTVVTPCFNSARYLPETIESVLGQRVAGSELQYIIIDGGSTDNTRAVVEACGDPRLEFISEPDNGMYDALAKGLRRATGDVVSYLNASDIYHPGAFEILAEVFANPGVDWVTGYNVHINEKSQITAAWKPPRYRREFIANGTYLQGHPVTGIQQESTFWSGKINAGIDFEALKTLRRAGDYFLWTDLARRTELHSVMSLLGAFRQHAGQISENMGDYLDEIRPLLRQPTRRERLTAYWEYRCNPALRGLLWKWILPRSPARIFQYSRSSERWEGV